MRRRPADGDRRSRTVVVLLAAVAVAVLLYTAAVLSRRRSLSSDPTAAASLPEPPDCCRGAENLELWGSAVRWGTEFRRNSSSECCAACRSMCPSAGGACLCNSWVFCGDEGRCREKFGQCWLKKQNDPMFPHVAEAGEQVMWTSGIIFGKGEGIIALETDHGTIRIQLFPHFAPNSMSFFSELLKLKYSVGCHFYRAEPRGRSWDDRGDHINNAPLGPPYGLIQGTFAVDGSDFKKLPKEECKPIHRGSVAWVGSGPDFIISLADHHEWETPFTTFGVVVSEDMPVVEAIAELPTKPDRWNGVEVKVLENPVDFKVKRFEASG